MARKKAKLPPNTANTLTEKLRRGENVVGVEGYIPFGGYDAFGDSKRPVFIRVRIVGLHIPEETCGGVKLKGEVVSGLGQVEVDPSQFYDTLDGVLVETDKQQRLELAKSIHKRNGSHHYLHSVRAAIEGFVNNGGMTPDAPLSPEQIKEYWTAVDAQLWESTRSSSPKKSGKASEDTPSVVQAKFPPKISRNDLKHWSAIACAVACGLPQEDVENIEGYSW